VPAESVLKDPSDSSQAPGRVAAARARASASGRLAILGAGLIVLAALAAYCNTFSGPFIYDDIYGIADNQTIRQLWPLTRVFSPPREGETVSGRPLLNLSLAVNYAIGGLNVWGYHATNLLIHIANALLLFGILRRTFLSPTLRDRFGRAATPLALACALIWTLHPLQTESVTYIIQRAESLAGFFYLLTLYCVIRGTGPGTVPIFAPTMLRMVPEMGLSPAAGSKGTVPFSADQDTEQNRVESGEKGDSPPASARFWYVAAVLVCLLGMASKEVMGTAPLIVLLYDRTFLAGSFAEAWRRRRGLYLGLVGTWALLAYLVFSTGLIPRQSEMGAPDPWSYARTQPGVILHYVRLSVWPRPLCLHHAWPVANRLGEIFPGAMVVAVLLAATAWGLMGRKVWGFLGAWFFLILAPTSSIFHLADVACEHRMYLPLAAVAVLVVAGGYAFWDRLLPRPAVSGFPAALARWAAPAAAFAAVLTALGYATVVRNTDYRSLLAMSQDSVDKHPGSVYAHNNLGNALAAVGETDLAIEHYLEALRLKPGYFVTYNNLGSVLFSTGRTKEAIQQYQQALRLKPDYAHAHNNLANALAAVGRTGEAIEHYHQALRWKPLYAEAHYNLASVLAGLGRTGEAIEHYHRALQLKPDDAEAHHHLALALAAAGKIDEAIADCREALRLKPHFAAAHYALAKMLAGTGKISESIEHYQRLLQLVPDAVEPLNNLAWLLATGEPAQRGDPARAVRLAQRARELGGEENPQCLDTLAAAYAAAGRFPDALITAQRALQLAASSGQTALVSNIQSRLALYGAGRPYREAPQLPRQITSRLSPAASNETSD
jgi:tetratricopeptide (TPR) repeat protein